MSGEIAKECKDGVSQKGSVGQNCGGICRRGGTFCIQFRKKRVTVVYELRSNPLLWDRC
jgi:hypothetical protein